MGLDQVLAIEVPLSLAIFNGGIAGTQMTIVGRPLVIRGARFARKRIAALRLPR